MGSQSFRRGRLKRFEWLLAEQSSSGVARRVRARRVATQMSLEFFGGWWLDSTGIGGYGVRWFQAGGCEKGCPGPRDDSAALGISS